MRLLMAPNDYRYLVVFLFLAVVPALLIAELVSAQQSSPGQEIYASKCANCHGVDGKAATKVGQMTQTPDMTTQPWQHGTSQAEVKKIIREGAGKMKGYQNKLKPEEIAAVARYVRRLCGVEQR